MRVSRSQLRMIVRLVLMSALSLSVVAACGDVAPSDAPHAAGSSRSGAELVLLARSRLLETAGLDSSATQNFPGVWRTRSYVSGEELLTDLKEGTSADVVEVCTDETAERLAQGGLLQPLDTTRIAHWDRLYQDLVRLPGVVVDGRVYMVPLTASVTGILYDRVSSRTVPDSFADLFSRPNKGHLGFPDDAALAFQIAALQLGLPDAVAPTTEQALQAEVHLTRHRRDFRSFWRDLDNLASAFEGGRVTIAVGDRQAALELQRRGAPVAFTLAAEGQPLAACGLAITSQARDLDAAYALINALLQPAAQASLAVATGEMVANRDAVRLVEPDDRRRLGLADLDGLEHPVARVPELEHIDWIQAWYEVKMGRG